MFPHQGITDFITSFIASLYLREGEFLGLWHALLRQFTLTRDKKDGENRKGEKESAVVKSNCAYYTNKLQNKATCVKFLEL